MNHTVPLALEPAKAEEPREKSGSSRVRCPKCQWRPDRNTTWTCTPMGHPEYYVNGACGHSWNTFDTRGRCPGCRHQWKNTMCLACGELSPHKAWYEPVAGQSP